jgi:hypothetical protein
MPDERNYRAFLVRLWAVSQGDEVVWRGTVQDAHTGARMAFADLAGLCEFLKAVTATPPARQPDELKPSWPSE